MSPAAFHTGLGLLFTVLCIIGIAVLAWLALRRPPARRPSCGSCGYLVEGLEALSCPECGSDLREVGIVTPTRRMLHPGLFILFWSLLLVIPCATAFTIAMRAGPRVMVANATFGLTSTSGAMPQLHIDQRVEATGIGPGVSVSSVSMSTVTRDGVTTTTILLPTISAATVRSRTIDVQTAADAVQLKPPRLTLETPDGEPGAIDAATLEPVFGERELEDLELGEDAAEVAALLDAMLKGDAAFTSTRLSITGGAGSSAILWSRWYAPTLVAIGAAIYGLGILLYLVLRRRRLSPARE